MLDTNDLVQMRADAAALMPGSCVIHTQSTASDGGGGWTETFTAGSTVACRLASIGGGERRATGARVDDRTTHILTVPQGTTIAEKDRVVVSGATYEVTAVRVRNAWEIARRVEVMEAP